MNPLVVINALRTGSAVSNQVFTTGLAIAALLGGGIGWLASRATSPREESVKNVQREYMADKLQWELGLAKHRLKALDAPPGKPKGVKTLRMGV